MGVAAHLVRWNAEGGEVDAYRVPTVRSLPVGWWLLVLVVGVRLSGRSPPSSPPPPHGVSAFYPGGITRCCRHSTPRTQFHASQIDHIEATLPAVHHCIEHNAASGLIYSRHDDAVRIGSRKQRVWSCASIAPSARSQLHPSSPKTQRQSYPLAAYSRNN